MKLENSLKNLALITVLSLMAEVPGFAQGTGSFKGKIIEQSTKQPVIGASVMLDNTQFTAATDTLGVFTIDNLAAGSYSVTFTSVGFQTKNIPEIIISPNKAYYSEVELLEDATTLEGVTISTFKRENNPLTPVSSFSYSREEIFRNPGAQGDIMRALSTLPGVVSSGSQFSAIAARGQGTRDNVYMVDDIPMFNLSHLEAEGFASGFNDPNGGRFSIFAPRIIDNVTFQNGGFGATYGRRSSSYLGLGVKEGNRASWSFSAQADLLGGTVIADGPISKKTSLFVAGRYQNFAMLINLLDEQRAAVSFGDYLIKSTTELNDKNKLSVIAMFNPEATSRTIGDIEAGIDMNEDNSGRTMLWDHQSSQAVVGLNLRTLLNSSSYLTNVLYYRASTVDNNFGRFNPSLDNNGIIINPIAVGYENRLRHITNDQQEVGYRSIYTKNFDKVKVIAGVDAMMVNLNYERLLSRTDTIYTFRTRDISAHPTQYYQILDSSQFNAAFDDNAFNGSGYVTLSWKVANGFTLTPGIRYDFTGFTEQHTLSPRLSGSIALNSRHSINFASGIYYQDAGYADVAGQAAGNTLKNERAIQSIIGYKMQMSNDLKFVAEGWHKRFDDVTVQPNRAQSYLTNNGSGYAYGADFSLTKRLSDNYYGQVSYSYMESKRDDQDGFGEYDYIFNVPHTVSLMGSYKPNEKWIFSGKFRYSSGRPTDSYTIHPDVFNNPDMIRYSQEVTAVNGNRLPDFISLDARADYNMRREWGTFSAFVDLVNISNRFNVNSEQFVPETGGIMNIGLGVFPTFGVRVEL